MMTTGISINLIISDIVHKSESYQLFLLPVLCTALHIVSTESPQACYITADDFGLIS